MITNIKSTTHINFNRNMIASTDINTNLSIRTNVDYSTIIQIFDIEKNASSYPFQPVLLFLLLVFMWMFVFVLVYSGIGQCNSNIRYAHQYL